LATKTSNEVFGEATSLHVSLT